VAAWHARRRRRDPQQEQRLQDLVRLLAKEVGLAPEDFA
jgi:hypothetical protein